LQLAIRAANNYYRLAMRIQSLRILHRIEFPLQPLIASKQGSNLPRFVPLEILTAADILPFRIMGNPKEPITIANAYIDPANCPYLKSCFDGAMKGGW